MVGLLSEIVGYLEHVLVFLVLNLSSVHKRTIIKMFKSQAARNKVVVFVKYLMFYLGFSQI